MRGLSTSAHSENADSVLCEFEHLECKDFLTLACIRGKCVYKDTNLVYEGQFRHGVADGEGTLRWPNGTVYSGTVTGGQPVQGRLDKSDGETLFFEHGAVVSKAKQFAFSMFTGKVSGDSDQRCWERPVCFCRADICACALVNQANNTSHFIHRGKGSVGSQGHANLALFAAV